VAVGAAVGIEEAPHEGEQRDAFQLSAALGITAVLRAAHRGLEPLGVAQRLGRQRRDHLAEANVTVGKRFRVPFGSQEDRADDRPSPPDRHDDDRSHVAEVEQRLDVGEHGIVRGVGHEHRFARLEGALELRIAVEIDDEVADRRILVARDEPNIAGLAGEEDRAPVQAEGVAELACDRLEDVYEVERGGDFLENVDERDQLVTLALQLRNPGLQTGDLPSLA
jgi:hypothetical protein